MAFLTCNCRGRCTTAAIIAGAVIGVLAAFFQITGIITVTTAFLWVAFGIAVGYLGAVLLATALARRAEDLECTCTTLNTLLVGILGTILLAVVLLAVGIVATSVVSAILTGLLLFFLTLTLAGTACLVRCLAGCEN